jgi:hypothetical protein
MDLKLIRDVGYILTFQKEENVDDHCEGCGNLTKGQRYYCVEKGCFICRKCEISKATNFCGSTEKIHEHHNIIRTQKEK